MFNRNSEDIARYLSGSFPRDLDEEAVYDLLAPGALAVSARRWVRVHKIASYIASALQIPAVPAAPFAGTLRGAHSLS